MAFKSCQPAQLHIQDRLSLALTQIEAGHQTIFGNIRIRRFSDGFNHSIQVAQCDQQTFQDVGALARFCELKFGTACDNLAAVLNEQLQRPFERQKTRFIIHQRQHLYTKSGLQRCKFIKLVEHLFRLSSAF